MGITKKNIDKYEGGGGSVIAGGTMLCLIVLRYILGSVF